MAYVLKDAKNKQGINETAKERESNNEYVQQGLFSSANKY